MKARPARMLGFLFILAAARADSAALPIPGGNPPGATLVSSLPDPPVITVPEILALAQLPAPLARDPVPVPPPAPSAADLVVVAPDADGVLDEARVASVGDSDGIPNPFRVRARPPLPIVEVRLSIESIVIGGRPDRNAAVINGALYSPGETLDGMRVAAISAEAVELRHNQLLFRVPAQDGPVTLRLSR
jgi:hypothetical protein